MINCIEIAMFSKKVLFPINQKGNFNDVFTNLFEEKNNKAP